MIDAISHLFNWLTVSGYIVNVGGEIAHTPEHFAQMIADADAVRVYAYERAAGIDNRDTPTGRPVAWFDAMHPCESNCSAEEAIYDYSAGPVAESWYAAFERYSGNGE